MPDDFKRCSYCKGTGRWTTPKLICRDGKKRITKVNCPACNAHRTTTSSEREKILVGCIQTLLRECIAWRDWCKTTPNQPALQSIAWDLVCEAATRSDQLDIAALIGEQKENSYDIQHTAK